MTYLCLAGSGNADQKQQTYYTCCKSEELLREGITPIKGVTTRQRCKNRLGKLAKYVVLRPDFFIHSVASDLDICLQFSGQRWH